MGFFEQHLPRSEMRRSQFHPDSESDQEENSLPPPPSAARMPNSFGNRINTVDSSPNSSVSSSGVLIPPETPEEASMIAGRPVGRSTESSIPALMTAHSEDLLGSSRADLRQREPAHLMSVSSYESSGSSIEDVSHSSIIRWCYALHMDYDRVVMTLKDPCIVDNTRILEALNEEVREELLNISEDEVGQIVGELKMFREDAFIVALCCWTLYQISELCPHALVPLWESCSNVSPSDDDFIGVVLGCITSFQDNSELVLNGLMLIWPATRSFARDNLMNRPNTIPLICFMIEKYIDSLEVARVCCMIVSNIASFESYIPLIIREFNGHKSAIETIIMITKLFCHDLLIAVHGLKCLLNVTVVDEAAKIILMLDGLELVVHIMDVHEADASIQKYACLCLLYLTVNGEAAQAKLCPAGGHIRMVNALKRFWDDEYVATQAVWALWGSSVRDEVKKWAYEEGDGDVIKVVAKTLQHFPGNVRIQQCGCGVIANFSVFRKNIPRIFEYGGLYTVLDAMEQHSNSMQVLANACGAIKNLFVRCPEDTSSNTLYADVKQCQRCIRVLVKTLRIDTIPLNILPHVIAPICNVLDCAEHVDYFASVQGIEILTSVIKRINSDCAMCRRYAMMIYLVVAETPGGLLKLFNCGGFVPVVSMLAKETSNSEVVESALYILQSASQKEQFWVAIARADAIPVLASTLGQFMQHLDLAMGCIIALKNLSASSKLVIRMGCVVHLLIEVIRTHSCSNDLLHHALRLVRMIAGASLDLRESLAAHGCIETVISIMARNGDKIMQLFCISALGILSMSEKNTLQIANAGGIEATLGAMRLFSSSPEVQEYGCVALQFMGVFGQESCLKIVELGGIEVIMQALNLHKHIPENVATATSALRCLVNSPGNAEVVEKHEVLAVLEEYGPHRGVGVGRNIRARGR